MYSGPVPGPYGGHMAMMPISTVQPIVPLQRADGYPICCKPDPGTGGRPGNGGTGAQGYPPVQQAQRHLRQPVTHAQAAAAVADNMISQGDPRPRPDIMNEVVQDLMAACPKGSGHQPNSSVPAVEGGDGSSGLLSAASGALGGGGGSLGAATGALGAANGPLGVASGVLGAGGGPLGAASGLLGGAAGAGGAGDLLGGLLGSGQGLNVLGLLAIGMSLELIRCMSIC